MMRRMYLSSPPPTTNKRQHRIIFKQTTFSLNSEFSFSYTGYFIKGREHNLPSYLPIVRGRGEPLDRCFSNGQSETQTASSRIWTHAADSISCDARRTLWKYLYLVDTVTKKLPVILTITLVFLYLSQITNWNFTHQTVFSSWRQTPAHQLYTLVQSRTEVERGDVTVYYKSSIHSTLQ